MTEQSFFGTTKSGESVFAYRITNRNGLSVTVLDYGCTLQSVCIPYAGRLLDVCLGYDTIAEYEHNDGNLGAVIGRYAGRIPDGLLELGEKRYRLTQNDGENHLHGGTVGFDRKVFRAKTVGNSVILQSESADGEEGYPASLSVSVAYTLTDDDVLQLSMHATSDGLTVWNPTHHAYWNLNGHDSGTTRSHMLKLPADFYVPVDSFRIPLGEPQAVAGTEFDFRTSKLINDGKEFDHSFILTDNPTELTGESGIGMQITTDCRAVQLYTANFLTDRRGKHGAIYRPHGAICLEPESRQLVRRAPMPEESILHPGETKTHTIEYRFMY